MRLVPPRGYGDPVVVKQNARASRRGTVPGQGPSDSFVPRRPLLHVDRVRVDPRAPLPVEIEPRFEPVDTGLFHRELEVGLALGLCHLLTVAQEPDVSRQRQPSGYSAARGFTWSVERRLVLSGTASAPYLRKPTRANS